MELEKDDVEMELEKDDVEMELEKADVEMAKRLVRIQEILGEMELADAFEGITAIQVRLVMQMAKDQETYNYEAAVQYAKENLDGFAKLARKLYGSFVTDTLQ
jgi:hypothetical protein